MSKIEDFAEEIADRLETVPHFFRKPTYKIEMDFNGWSAFLARYAPNKFDFKRMQRISVNDEKCGEMDVIIRKEGNTPLPPK